MNHSIKRRRKLHISMGQVGKALDTTFLLVNDICSVSARAAKCAIQHHCSPGRSPFIDWYLVLQIDENAEVEDIKKQYRRLALQLHPDKNKHPKAEIAFKLVSEAYKCLSDGDKRAGFNLERIRSFCIQCHDPAHIKVKGVAADTSSKRWMRSKGSIRRVKELKSRMVIEATTIEKCLRNAGSRGELSALGLTELPIFNPLDHLHHGYPHSRNGLN